jgi:hypothetical protein
MAICRKLTLFLGVLPRPGYGHTWNEFKRRGRDFLVIIVSLLRLSLDMKT